MKTTKNSIFTSLIALLVLISMFVGTTFAWFTDIVTSANNIIKTGKLDANMYWSDKLLPTDSDNLIEAGWKNAAAPESNTIFNHNNWEPGYTEVRYVLIENYGSLDFKWRLTIDAEGKVTDLAKVIEVYYITEVDNAVEKTDLNDKNYAGTLEKVLAEKTRNDGILESGERVLLAIAFHMDELAGNEYQDMHLCEGGFALNLIATQASATGESDSFDDLYDEDAEWPYVNIKYNVGKTISEGQVTKETNDAGEEVSLLNAPLSLGEPTDDIFANIPSGVTLADGADKLTLKVESVETPNADVPVESGETAKAVDVHVDGVSEDNTTPMQITLNKFFDTGLNTTSIKMYHIENDVPVEMTLVANPVNHNEFSYDPATGDVVISIASFSNIVPITKDLNLWEGDAVTDWYNDNDTEFTLSTPQQLAGLGVLVDNGNSFAGKTIYLGKDIDLGGTISFNPIGCGYVNGTGNSNGVTGRAFSGTFDGQGFAIRNLYVNGWDLGLSYCNLGGGLFASVYGTEENPAIIRNVNMVNAEIVMECVEQGVIAGLAQGDCLFDNIKINGCSVANYQRATGGVVGEVSQGIDAGRDEVFTHTFKDIYIDSETVVGSLWGDFDAPVGGVIGGYWDDSNTTKVVMEDVTVACRLDVYNDVTSTYQWYAYRRAGMLIGNTDNVASDGRTASADFLICKKDDNGNNTVFVYYGENWRNYHYCEFNNANPNWPFVRVEAGEHCTAFSNPRWGVPELNGVKVTPENHPITEQKTHENGDDCMVLLPFNQLYGGGQGVYGQTNHTNVTVKTYAYSIQYINDSKVIAETLVESNATAYDVYGYDSNNDVVSYGNGASAQTEVKNWLLGQGYKENEIEFGGWVNAGSTKMPTIPAGNTTNIKLYPYFNSPYTARFVDSYGNVIAWCLFHSEKTEDLDTTANAAQAALPGLGEDFTFDYWEVHVTDGEGNTTSTEEFSKFDFTNATTDVTIYPVYKYNGDVSLIPVDTDGDGVINHYEVAGYSNPNGQALVEIPASVNGKPILQINKNAFASYGGVHSIVVPNGVTIKQNAFTSGTEFGKGEEITIYFEGTKDQWEALTKEIGWDYGIGTGTRVFFLKDGKVDTNGVYLQVTSSGYVNKKYSWSEKTDFDSVKSIYTSECTCEEQTDGDTGHVYKDANGNTLNHNDAGTPVNDNNVEIKYDVIGKGGFLNLENVYGLTDGTITTYKRYRLDAKYWE